MHKKLEKSIIFGIFFLLLFLIVAYSTGFVTRREGLLDNDILIFIIVLAAMIAVFLLAFFLEHRNMEELYKYRTH